MKTTMKKVAVVILAAGLFLSAIQGAKADPKDSTWLANENVMTSSIEHSSDGQPIGMIAIWPTHDAIPEGWLECNGQAVDAVKYPEYIAKFGATTPDYRGFFLRGYGGKSADLGVAQDYAVQTNGDRLNIYGLGMTKIDYLSDASYTSASIDTSGLKQNLDSLKRSSTGISSDLGSIRGALDNLNYAVNSISNSVNEAGEKLYDDFKTNTPLSFSEYFKRFYFGAFNNGTGVVISNGVMIPDYSDNVSSYFVSNMSVGSPVSVTPGSGSGGSGSSTPSKGILYKQDDGNKDKYGYINNPTNGMSNAKIIDSMVDKYNDYLSGLGYHKMLTYSDYIGNRLVNKIKSANVVNGTGGSVTLGVTISGEYPTKYYDEVWSDAAEKSAMMAAYYGYLTSGFNPVPTLLASSGSSPDDVEPDGLCYGCVVATDGSDKDGNIRFSGGSLTTHVGSQYVVTRADNGQVQGFTFEIDSPAGETRPINKAVKYIVKVE